VTRYLTRRWLTTKACLAINGQRLLTSADDGEQFMIDLVAGSADVPAIATWLSGHCSPVPAPDLPENPPN